MAAPGTPGERPREPKAPRRPAPPSPGPPANPAESPSQTKYRLPENSAPTPVPALPGSAAQGKTPAIPPSPGVAAYRQTAAAGTCAPAPVRSPPPQPRPVSPEA